MRSFASDNNSGVHPLVMEALKAIETEYEPSEERDLILNFIKSSSRGIVRGSIDE